MALIFGAGLAGRSLSSFGVDTLVSWSETGAVGGMIAAGVILVVVAASTSVFDPSYFPGLMSWSRFRGMLRGSSSPEGGVTTNCGCGEFADVVAAAVVVDGTVPFVVVTVPVYALAS